MLYNKLYFIVSHISVIAIPNIYTQIINNNYLFINILKMSTRIETDLM